MKNFTKSAALFLAACTTLFSVSSCTENAADENGDIAAPVPAVNSVEVQSGTLASTSATIDIKFEKCDEVHYAYYLTDDAPDAETKEWNSREYSTSDSEDSVELSDLEYNKSYTFEAYATKNGASKSDVKSVTFITKELDAPIVEVTDAKVLLSVNAKFFFTITGATKYVYTCYSEDAVPNEENKSWTEVEITEDGDYFVIIEKLTPSSSKDLKYIFEVYATNDSKKSEIEKTDVTIEKIEGLSVSNVKEGAMIINMDVEFDETACAGYYYECVKSDEFSMSAFKAKADAGLVNELLVTKSGNLAVGAAGSSTITTGLVQVTIFESRYLTPGTEYTVTIATVTPGDDGAYNIVGEPISANYTTDSSVFGDDKSDATIVALPDNNLTGFKSLTGVCQFKEGIVGAYTGCLLKSALGSQSIEEWVADNFNSFSDPFTFYSLVPNNGRYVLNKSEKVSASYLDLNADTEYLLYAVAIDSNGYIGKVSSVNAKTKAMIFNEDLEIPTLTCEGKSTEIIVNIDLKDFEYGYYIYKRKADAAGITDDNIYAEVISNIEVGNKQRLSKAFINPATNTIEVEIGFLHKTTEYVIYVVGVDEDGNFSRIAKAEGATKEPEATKYDSAATVNAKITAKDVRAAGSGYTDTYLNFSVEMQGTTTKYAYFCIAPSAVVNASGVENPTAEDYANYAVKTYDYTITDAANVSEFMLDNNSDMLLIIPIITQEKEHVLNSCTLGTPVLLDPADFSIISYQ